MRSQVEPADDPFAILGPHAATRNGRPAIVIRTMQPSASGVELVIGDAAMPMERGIRTALFELFIDADGRSARDLFYRLRVHEGGASREFIDPYRFGQVLGDFDLHLFSEGNALSGLGETRQPATDG
jgi:1,4-alpha-glucan branching enzyme